MASFTPRALFQQVMEELLREIEQGEWIEYLPGETALAERFGVSRPVLRQALAALREQGVINTARGRRTQITLKTAAPGQLKRQRRLLIASPRALTSEARPAPLEHLRAALERRGWQWIEHGRREFAFDRGKAALLKLWEESRAERLLLIGSTSEMQQWAVEACLPALLLGSPAPGVKLPFVDIHYHALGSHAAGRFKAAGVQRITAFVRSPMRMGDQATVRGMREQTASMSTGGVEIVEAESSRALFVRQLERVLRKPGPHGWLFFFPGDVVTATTHLLATGRRPPQDVALISREAFPHIEAFIPALAHYRTDAAHLVRRVVALVERPSSSGGEALILPRFVSGETL